ncbi:glycosyltransferase family 4 protein [Azospirillum halopraeferens]|uniref:glycosyltransferase family 4 protein n=1 Tax=Azospirillum halopraeferens TaxID=34010 RepID=UPI0004278500|nr:glycosyltransferase family 4 protein [Azospirillum halopraeferens]
MSARPSILFVNRVFPPDRGATGRCLSDLAGRMAAAGWRVGVLADGDGPAAAPPGVTVVRTGGGGCRPGAAGYAAALARLVARGLTLPRHDVVVTMTDPPLLALAGPILAARHRAAAIHWCHDVFPALFPVVGIHLPRPVRGVLDSAMVRALRRHDAVVAIGRCMEARLKALGVPEDRLSVIPNWADPSVRPLPRAGNPLRERLALGDRFTVAYCGNVGLAHPLGALFDAARREPDTAFLLVGDGRGYPPDGDAPDRPSNLHRLPFQPAERLSQTLAAADLHVATMDRRAQGLLVPCKVATVLAAGRPCLFLGPAGSEAARVVVAAGCGAVLDPDDGAALAGAVRRFATDANLAARCSERALAAAGCRTADHAAVRFRALAEAVRRPKPSVAYGEAPHG